MAKTLIAGGAGFIGSHLCDVCIIEHDIVNLLVLDDEIESIYNLACPASPKAYQKDPIQTLKKNFIGAMNLLELAK